MVGWLLVPMKLTAGLIFAGAATIRGYSERRHALVATSVAFLQQFLCGPLAVLWRNLGSSPMVLMDPTWRVIATTAALIAIAGIAALLAAGLCWRWIDTSPPRPCAGAQHGAWRAFVTTGVITALVVAAARLPLATVAFGSYGRGELADNSAGLAIVLSSGLTTGLIAGLIFAGKAALSGAPRLRHAIFAAVLAELLGYSVSMPLLSMSGGMTAFPVVIQGAALTVLGAALAWVLARRRLLTLRPVGTASRTEPRDAATTAHGWRTALRELSENPIYILPTIAFVFTLSIILTFYSRPCDPDMPGWQKSICYVPQRVL